MLEKPPTAPALAIGPARVDEHIRIDTPVRLQHCIAGTDHQYPYMSIDCFMATNRELVESSHRGLEGMGNIRDKDSKLVPAQFTGDFVDFTQCFMRYWSFANLVDPHLGGALAAHLEVLAKLVKSHQGRVWFHYDVLRRSNLERSPAQISELHRLSPEILISAIERARDTGGRPEPAQANHSTATASNGRCQRVLQRGHFAPGPSRQHALSLEQVQLQAHGSTPTSVIATTSVTAAATTTAAATGPPTRGPGPQPGVRLEQPAPGKCVATTTAARS